MKTVLKISKYLLIGWGAVCTIFGTLIVGSIAYNIIFRSVSRDVPASSNDVRNVLNWCRIGTDRLDKVLHSHRSPRSFNGDHFDAHAIRLTHISENELTKDETAGGWFRCDQVSGALKDALKFVGAWVPSEEVPWFPTEAELQSSNMYVWSWSLRYDGVMPSSAELIFVNPKDKMLYFFDVAM